MAQKAPTDRASAPAVSRFLVADSTLDLSVEGLEKAIYACLAQADLAIEAMNAHLSVEQLIAAKEADAKAKAEAAAKAVEAKSGYVLAPTGPKQPIGAPVVPTDAAGAVAQGCVIPQIGRASCRERV